MIILLIALAAQTAALSPEEVFIERSDDICGYAMKAAERKPDENNYPLYVGRMETRMDELGVAESEKDTYRFLCKIYLRGSTNGMRHAMDIVKEVQQRHQH